MAEIKKYNRIFTIVIDSLGIGAAADAAAYGDAGTDTLGHIAQQTENFKIPNLQKLGIANLHSLHGVLLLINLQDILQGYMKQALEKTQ